MKKTQSSVFAFAGSFNLNIHLATMLFLLFSQGSRKTATMAFSTTRTTSKGRSLTSPSRRLTLSFVQPQQPQQRASSLSFTCLFSSSAKKEKEEVDPGAVEGTDLRIVKYPHPSLRETNQEINLDSPQAQAEVADIAKQMLKVMYAADGVGLAAPQVGINQRLMVYNPTGRWLDETVLVNPQIIEYSQGKDVETEGCLSFPEMDGEVRRSKWIKVEAMTLKGKKIKKKYTGWEARIFQHEYDHLDGVVYIDRLEDPDKERVQPRLQELIEDFGEGGVL